MDGGEDSENEHVAHRGDAGAPRTEERQCFFLTRRNET